jgi:hypothetical protein
MRKLALTIGLSASMLVATSAVALGAIRIDSFSFFGSPSSALVTERGGNARLVLINEKLYPDTVAVPALGARSNARLVFLNEALYPDTIWADHIVIIKRDNWLIT